MPDTDFYLPLDGVPPLEAWLPSAAQVNQLLLLQQQARENALIRLRREYGAAPEYYGLPLLLKQQEQPDAIGALSLKSAANLSALGFFLHRCRPLQPEAFSQLQRLHWQNFLRKQQIRIWENYLAEFYYSQLATLLPSRWLPEARLANRISRMLNGLPAVTVATVELELAGPALAGSDWLAWRNRQSIATLKDHIQRHQPTAVILLEQDRLPASPRLAIATGFQNNSDGVLLRLAGFQWSRGQCEYQFTPDGRSCSPVFPGSGIRVAGIYPVAAVPMIPPVERLSGWLLRKTGLGRWLWRLRPVPGTSQPVAETR